MPLALQMNGLRRNEDAMKCKSRSYTNCVRSISVVHSQSIETV